MTRSGRSNPSSRRETGTEGSKLWVRRCHTRAQDAAGTIEAVAAKGDDRKAKAARPEKGMTNQTLPDLGELPPWVRHVRTFLEVGPSSEELWLELRPSRSAPSLALRR